MQNYLRYGNSSLPGTRLSFGNLHSLREIGVRRGPGKTHAREITTSERELSCGDGVACLRLPSSPSPFMEEARVALPGLWQRPPQVHLAQGLGQVSPSGRTRLPQGRAIPEGPRLRGAAWQKTRGILRPKAKFGELGITRTAKRRKVAFPARGSRGTV